MLSAAEFSAFAKEVVPFLHVTSRLEGASYPDLLSQKGGRGFPYLVAMDAEGRVTAQAEQRSVDGFRSMVEAAAKEIEDIEARGGVIEAVESGYLKQRLVESNATRLRAIETGEQIVVGVNKFTETAPCPLTLAAEWLHTVADSNLAVYDYVRNVWSLSLSWQY